MLLSSSYLSIVFFFRPDDVIFIMMKYLVYELRDFLAKSNNLFHKFEGRKRIFCHIFADDGFDLAIFFVITSKHKKGELVGI